MVCMIAPRMLQYNKLSCRQKPRLARSVNHAQPHSKSLFRRGKSEIARRKSRFPCGKGKIRAGNHVSRTEKRNPTQEIAFPVRERQNPAQEITFPVREKRNPAQEITFPVRERQN